MDQYITLFIKQAINIEQNPFTVRKHYPTSLWWKKKRLDKFIVCIYTTFSALIPKTKEIHMKHVVLLWFLEDFEVQLFSSDKNQHNDVVFFSTLIYLPNQPYPWLRK